MLIKHKYLGAKKKNTTGFENSLIKKNMCQFPDDVKDWIFLDLYGKLLIDNYLHENRSW